MFLQALLLLFALYNPPEATEFTLSNGMHLILIEDHSFPLVNVTIVVGAGSSKEEEYNSGLSHLLEHMLFDGTETRSREELRDGFEKKGIYANAFTREDFVAYLITTPSEYLRYGLELQADMLLHSIIPVDELEKEKKVVIEELKKDAADPENVAQELFDRFALEGTPYSTPVIGYPNVIKNVTREELYRFYKTYYVPSNMTAIIMGDFSSEEVIDIFEELYGSIPPAKVAKNEKHFTFRPKNKIFKKRFKTDNIHLRIGVPAPPLNSDDLYAFDVFVELLNGEGGLLARELKEGENSLAIEAYATHVKHRDFNYLLFSITTDDTSKIEKIIEKLEELFIKVKDRGVSKKDVERAKRKIEIDEAYLRENFTYFTMGLTYWVPLGGYEAYRDYFEGIKGVSLRDIVRVVRNYYKDFKYTAFALIPGEEIKEERGVELTYNIRKKVLSNGLTVIAKENRGNPILSVNILVKNPLKLEPQGKNGVAHLLQRVIGRATERRSNVELQNILSEIGAKLKTADNPYMPFDDYYRSKGFSYVRFQVMKDNMKRGLDLLKEIVYEPSFDAGVVEEAKRYALSIIKRESSLSSYVAKEALYKKLFSGTFLEKPLMGVEEEVKGLTPEDVENFWKEAYSPHNLIVAIVGDDSPEKLIEEVERRFGNLKNSGGGSAGPSYTEDYPRGDTLIYLDREFAYIYGGRPIPPLSHEDSPAILVATLVLSKRLQNTLREKEGLAYRLGAYLRYWDRSGLIAIGMGTRSINIERALRGIKRELRNLIEVPPDSEEVEFVINDYWGHHLRYHQRSINQAHYLSYYEYTGVGYAYDTEQILKLRSVKREKLMEVIERYFKPEDFVFSVAGKLKH